MVVQFDQLSGDSIIWIYQANRKLNSTEEEIISEKVAGFLESWQAHGNPLKSGFTILYHHFLIIGVEESLNKASGCSIDKSVNMVKQLEFDHDIDFLDRSKVAFFKINGKGNEVNVISLTDIAEKVDKQEVTENAYLFNNLVQRKKDLEKNWIIPVTQGWTKKYFAEVN